MILLYSSSSAVAVAATAPTPVACLQQLANRVKICSRRSDKRGNITIYRLESLPRKSKTLWVVVVMLLPVPSSPSNKKNQKPTTMMMPHGLFD